MSAERTTAGPMGSVVAAIETWPRDAAVVRRGVEEAAVRGCPLTVLHVVDVDDDASGGEDGAPEGALAAAEHLVRQLRPRLRLRTTVEKGPVAARIVRASRSADLLLVGNKGPQPRDTVARDAVTINVAARAWCPVEVVPVPGPGSTRPVPCTRVVAVVTPAGRVADLAPPALAEAAWCDARLEFWFGDDAAPGHADDLAPWLSASSGVPIASVVVPGGVLAIIGALEPTDLVVTLRGTGAACWGRPDGATRALVEQTHCPVLVVPRRGPVARRGAARAGAWDQGPQAP